ncbi:hypothetical protein [Thermoanaerobacter thermohydrosulfuricus]|uniref:hypothetical protein n=1 Tax=Thermoanaerobacter thermohydrosulfuricus TaxID=1516 RepID=UPI0009422B82|nr:hypothetical protein [Thermoanaerobacter thermohydrosulfuricus]
MFANYSDKDIIDTVKKSRKILCKTAVIMANFYNTLFERAAHFENLEVLIIKTKKGSKTT